MGVRWDSGIRGRRTVEQRAAADLQTPVLREEEGGQGRDCLRVLRTEGRSRGR
jgi:hypothetical protein